MIFNEKIQKKSAFLWNIKYYIYFCTTPNHTNPFILSVVWCGVLRKYTTNSKKMKKSYDEFQRKCDFRMIMAFCALLAAIVFSPSYASAQNFTLQGSVKTEKGEPVPGATVIVSGTQLGATTDAQGNFSLRMAKKPAADASIVISYLGYTSQTIPIGNRTTFEVVLQEESTAMDEVVVVGYGTVRKKDRTGALSTVGG